MALWLEEKYVNRVSYKLDRFKKRGPYLWNFRCPFCGDSKKDKTKTRGYVYKKKDVLFFHCHNCHDSMFFGKFLQRLDPSLHREYTMEKFLDNPLENKNEEKMPARTEIPERIYLTSKAIKIPSIASLPFNHPVKQYVLQRKIPDEYLSEMYYAECFRSFLDEFKPEHGKRIPMLEKRLIIPFYDDKKYLLGIQGRALSESKLKYITILLAEDNTKVFGLDRLNLKEKIYVFEGPIDSMFVPNGIATMDSALFRVTDVMGLDNDYTFVYDNERRNPQILSNMEKTIELGRNVFIWPRNIHEKDINELVLKRGYGPNELIKLINDNTYEGMQAKLKFAYWKK